MMIPGWSLGWRFIYTRASHSGHLSLVISFMESTFPNGYALAFVSNTIRKLYFYTLRFESIAQDSISHALHSISSVLCIRHSPFLVPGDSFFHIHEPLFNQSLDVTRYFIATEQRCGSIPGWNVDNGIVWRLVESIYDGIIDKTTAMAWRYLGLESFYRRYMDAEGFSCPHS